MFLVARVVIVGGIQQTRRRRAFAIGRQRFVAGDAALFADPGAQVDQAATLTAERAKRRIGRPGNLALAGGAGHGGGSHRWLSRNAETRAVGTVRRRPSPQLQLASWNRTSSVVWTARVLGSCQ